MGVELNVSPVSLIPTEICLHQQSRLLEVAFEDGSRYQLPCEYLRVYSPSADVRGHSPEQAVLQTGKSLVNIVAVEPVGQYAIKLTFDDGHDSGLYTWNYLFELGRDYAANWQDYLSRLEQAGASRE